MGELMMRFRQWTALVSNTVRVLTADPLILILNLALLTGIGLMPWLPGYAFGQQLRLVREQSLALTFLFLLVFVVVAAGKVISDDLRSGTSSMIFVHPVGGFTYLFARFTGILGVASGMLLLGTVATMWSVRMAYHEFQAESLGTIVYFSALTIPLLLTFLAEFLFRIRYVFCANLLLTIFFFMTFILLGYWGYNGRDELGGWQMLDWRTPAVSLYLGFAVSIFSAMLTAASVFFRRTTLFLVGFLLTFTAVFLPSYIAEINLSVLRGMMDIILPDFHLFWVADVMGESESQKAFSDFSYPFRPLLLSALFAFGQTFFYLLIASWRLSSRERG